MAKAKSEATANSEPNAIVRYFRDTRAEMAKVTWPTREEWIRLSVIVLAVTFVMAVILGLADYVSALLMDLILY